MHYIKTYNLPFYSRRMGDISVRNALFEDLPRIVELENAIWPKGTRAPREKFEKRLAVFPEGFFLAFRGNQLIGASTSQIIHYFPEETIESWEKVTDNGYIEHTHNSQGNALYVVSLGAISRSGGGSALLARQKELAQEKELTLLVLGARISGYNSYCRKTGEITIERYVMLTRPDGQPCDDELRFYIRNGLKIEKIVPRYMEDDAESRNYGAIMLWNNLSFHS